MPSWVKVLRYADDCLAIHHGLRELARYDAQNQLMVDYDTATA